MLIYQREADVPLPCLITVLMSIWNPIWWERKKHDVSTSGNHQIPMIITLLWFYYGRVNQLQVCLFLCVELPNCKYMRMGQVIDYYYCHIWKNHHPLISYFRVPSGYQGRWASAVWAKRKAPMVSNVSSSNSVYDIANIVSSVHIVHMIFIFRIYV